MCQHVQTAASKFLSCPLLQRFHSNPRLPQIVTEQEPDLPRRIHKLDFSLDELVPVFSGHDGVGVGSCLFAFFFFCIFCVCLTFSFCVFFFGATIPLILAHVRLVNGVPFLCLPDQSEAERLEPEDARDDGFDSVDVECSWDLLRVLLYAAVIILPDAFRKLCRRRQVESEIDQPSREGSRVDCRAPPRGITGPFDRGRAVDVAELAVPRMLRKDAPFLALRERGQFLADQGQVVELAVRTVLIRDLAVVDGRDGRETGQGQHERLVHGHRSLGQVRDARRRHGLVVERVVGDPEGLETGEEGRKGVDEGPRVDVVVGDVEEF